MGKRRKKRLNQPSPARFNAEITSWQEGDKSKADPLFILVLNNIARECPFDSGNFVADFSTDSTKDKALFNTGVKYIKENLFGELPGQAEKLLTSSPHRAKIKFWSIYLSGMPIDATTSLVAEHQVELTDAIRPRWRAVVSMLPRLGVNPDIVFIASKSQRRAWAIPTEDDDNRGGIQARYDGNTIVHRYYHNRPGMIAISAVPDEMTPAHEFGHAFSSFSNGHVVDLYTGAFPSEPPWQVPGHFPLNKKKTRPIPNPFGTYQNKTFLSDQIRPPFGYGDSILTGDNWTSYHSELADTRTRALMDKYRSPAVTDPMACVHDKLTKAYIMDRIAAKTSR